MRRGAFNLGLIISNPSWVVDAINFHKWKLSSGAPWYEGWLNKCSPVWKIIAASLFALFFYENQNNFNTNGYLLLCHPKQEKAQGHLVPVALAILILKEKKKVESKVALYQIIQEP